ncbi:hypothetical protein FRC15_004962 [Serendipita sp. 397]|nr:hypothetical protein FRC15_004962 [Serendipita sp. 397]
MSFLTKTPTHNNPVLVEVCVDSVESSRAAFEAGADRLEVCASLAVGGGTTPSQGLVKAIQSLFPRTPLMVMIRPRVGDFVYSEDDLDVMKFDIRNFKTMGIKGFVFGVLTEIGDIDVHRTASLVQEALPLEVTFHRAFDMSNDLEAALLAIQEIKGITRILTSGGKPKAPDGASTLRNLVKLSKSVIIIPGSGINNETIDIILPILPLNLPREIHMSGGGWSDGRSEVDPKAGMGMGASEEHAADVWKTYKHSVELVRNRIDFLEDNDA